MLPRTFEPEAYWRILLRRKWYAIALFLVTVTAATAYVFVTPKTYRASTLILVQRQTVPERYVNPTVSDTLGDRINTIRQQVTSRTNLESLIKTFSLYSANTAVEPEMLMQDKVELMARNIEVNVHRGTAFTISFIYDNPKKVTQVTNALTSNFIDANLRVREEQSIGTTEFLETELERFKKILATKEGVLTEFKQQRMGELPEDLDTNLRLMDQLGQKMASVDRSLDETRTQKIMIQQQAEALTKLQANTAGDVAGSDNLAGGSAELQELRNRLRVLRLRYTESHPDVVKVQSMIDKLEKEGQLQASTGDGGPTDTSAAPAGGGNLLGGQRETLQFQLASLQETIKGLQNEKAKLQKQIGLIAKRIETTPKNQLQLVAIQRDYDAIKTQYDQILSKKLQSEVAENMEKRQKGEQFKILDPARIPEKPFSPNIPKIMFAAVMFGMVAGVGAGLGVEFLDQSFRDYGDVTQTLQVPVLAVIPKIETAEAALKRRRRTRLGAYCFSGCFVLAVCLGIWLWLSGNLQPLMQKIRAAI
jgi:polysaccharide chain length determinant protein (PEP-CTERM system associated)